MKRILIFILLFLIFGSCKKKQNPILSEDVIKSNVVGKINEAFLKQDSTCIYIDLDTEVRAYNIAEFGATANDNIDDSWVIQKLIDENKDVIIPDGVFNINKSIEIIGKKNLQIYTLGSKAKLVSINIDSISIFNIKESHGILIKNINMIGGANKINASNIGVKLIGSNNSEICVQECAFDGTDNTGFNLAVDVSEGGKNLIVSNCVFRKLMGSSSGNGYGIHYKYVINGVACGNFFYGEPGRSRHAIYLSAGTQNCRVMGNYIENYEWEGISLNCYSYQTENKNNLIANNILKYGASYTGTLLGQISIFGKCWNNIIKNNILISSSQCGIVLNGGSGGNFEAKNIATDNLVIGNSIYNTKTSGIYLSGVKNTSILNNDIQNAGYGFNGGWGYSSIYIGPNVFDGGLPPSNNLLIKGNSFTGQNISRSCIYIDDSYSVPFNIKACIDNAFIPMRIAVNEYNTAKVDTLCK